MFVCVVGFCVAFRGVVGCGVGSYLVILVLSFVVLRCVALCCVVESSVGLCCVVLFCGYSVVLCCVVWSLLCCVVLLSFVLRCIGLWCVVCYSVVRVCSVVECSLGLCRVWDVFVSYRVSLRSVVLRCGVR